MKILPSMLSENTECIASTNFAYRQWLQNCTAIYPLTDCSICFSVGPVSVQWEAEKVRERGYGGEYPP